MCPSKPCQVTRGKQIDGWGKRWVWPPKKSPGRFLGFKGCILGLKAWLKIGEQHGSPKPFIGVYGLCLPVLRKTTLRRSETCGSKLQHAPRNSTEYIYIYMYRYVYAYLCTMYISWCAVYWCYSAYSAAYMQYCVASLCDMQMVLGCKLCAGIAQFYAFFMFCESFSCFRAKNNFMRSEHLKTCCDAKNLDTRSRIDFDDGEHAQIYVYSVCIYLSLYIYIYTHMYTQ